MSLPSTASDLKALCLHINAHCPAGGLFEGDRTHLHPDSNLPWRIAPEPFWLSPAQHRYLDQLGGVLHQFYRACNQLYHQSVKGVEPPWIHEYLDLGKPSAVREMGRWNRIKSQLPLVIRPDLLLTEDGFKLVELDAIPGGMGFTAQISEVYDDLGYDIIGGARGLIDPFYEAMAAAAKVAEPHFALFVSDESAAYRREMEWLVECLQVAGKPARSAHPREARFDENGLFLQGADEPAPWRIDAAYRFFELFDLKNIPKAELFAYFTKKNALCLTPPPKAYLEEKLWLALYHHPALKSYWHRALGKEPFAALGSLIPRSWIVDARPLPPHAIIPGLDIGGQPVNDWQQLKQLTKKQRELVLKPSGFSNLAYESKGVSIGHDLSEAEWAERVQEALDRFAYQPYVLQEFHKAARRRVRYYDFDRDEVVPMRGRVMLRPYYYVIGDAPRLCGIQALVFPADKKILHGMVDAAIMPCAASAEKSPF